MAKGNSLAKGGNTSKRSVFVPVKSRKEMKRKKNKIKERRERGQAILSVKYNLGQIDSKDKQLYLSI